MLVTWITTATLFAILFIAHKYILSAIFNDGLNEPKL